MLIAAAAGIFIGTKNDTSDQNIYPILVPVMALILFFHSIAPQTAKSYCMIVTYSRWITTL